MYLPTIVPIWLSVTSTLSLKFLVTRFNRRIPTLNLVHTKLIVSDLRSSVILVDTSYSSFSSCDWSMRQGVLSLPPSIVFVLNHMIANC